MKAAVVPVFVVIGLAGCLTACDEGSGRLSKSEYEAKMEAIVRDASSSKGLEMSTTGIADVPAYFRTLAKSLGEVAAETKALDPPREVAAVHARIVDGFAREAAIVKRFAGRLQGASASRVQLMLRRFDSAGFRAAYREIDAASRALAARGYRIRQNEGT